MGSQKPFVFKIDVILVNRAIMNNPRKTQMDRFFSGVRFFILGV
jgi:hypothetical protein